MKQKITIIGSGNLGLSIAQGLTKSGTKPSQITLTRRNIAALEPFAKEGYHTSGDNTVAAKNADIIILAVKPKQVLEVIGGMRKGLTKGQLVISVVTGVSIADLEKAADTDGLAIVRAMPNTAIAIGESMTCLAHKGASDEQQTLSNFIFEQVGKCVWINEELMEAATILGACGIAYALRYIRASTQGGIEIGFDSKTALLIASQTVKGAAELLLQLGSHPEAEIDKVTTPQGCTIVGLNEMEHQGFSSALIRGVQTSYKKIAKT